MSQFSLTAEPIAATPSAAQDGAGGYVVFEGRVRNQNEGRDVRSLEYEAFDELAVKAGCEVLGEALERFAILDVRCIHRTGHLQIGEVAIRVEAASAHRKAAFEACSWIVDEIKQRVPIWKKEHYADGDSGWINCEAPDDQMLFCHPGERGISNPNPRTPCERRDSSQARNDKTVGSEAAYYSRQVRLSEVGPEGQAKLKSARVLVVGAGGLGSPALLYLAAAGVGTIGIAEQDDLDESNLHRQVVYASHQIEKAKAEAAADRIRALNPYIAVVTHQERVTGSNAPNLVKDYDLVLDCTDNFRTKFLLNDICVEAYKPLIQASIYRYEGQLMVITPDSPCLRCLWPKTPNEGCVGSCAEVGVLGVVPGVFGTLQAAEAIKLILGLPSPLREGHMLLLDLQSYQQQMVSVARDPACPACGILSSSLPVETAAFNVDAEDIDLAEFLVIDVREPYEVRFQPMKSALNLPSTRFDLGRLPQADKYLLVCAHGIRSEAIAEAMWERGDHRFFSLSGGVAALKQRR